MELSTLGAQLSQRNYHLREMLYVSDSVKVYAVESQEGEAAVVKDITYSDTTTWEKATNEVNIILQLDHPCIVKIYDYFGYRSSAHTWQLAIIFEKVAKDLMRDIKDRRLQNYMWTQEELMSLYVEMVDVFAYLQEQGVAHRDIKPQNILIANGHVKITDFGTSKQTSLSLLKRVSTWTLVGTPYFLSPLLKKSLANRQNTVEHYVIKSDVYSLGLTFLAMAKLETPTDFAKLKSLRRVTQEITNSVVYNETIKNLLRLMLEEDEANRPDFIAIRDWLKSAAENREQSGRQPGCPHVIRGTPVRIVAPCHGPLCALCVYVFQTGDGGCQSYCSVCNYLLEETPPPSPPLIPPMQETLPLSRQTVPTDSNWTRHQAEDQETALKPCVTLPPGCAECLNVHCRALLVAVPGQGKLLCQGCLQYYEQYEDLNYLK